MIANGWAEMPTKQFIPLMFKTPTAAKAAYILARRAYAERDARQEAAHAVLCIEGGRREDLRPV